MRTFFAEKSTAEGTGIVHMAPGFGEDDQRLCEQAGIAVQEKLAPQVSDMLTKAARQLDPAPKTRRRSPLAAAVAATPPQ